MAKILAITGMHRSGTSLVANYLQRCGLNIGHTLHPADMGNPRGYYEDVDFLRFHKDLLSFFSLSTFPVEAAQVPSQIPERFRRRAQEILRVKEKYPVWGWKEPRTSLFLDFWQKMIDDFNVLFLLRHPVSAVDSLLRRGTDKVVKRRPAIAFQSWCLYNKLIFQFYCKHRTSCFLVDIDDFVRDATGVVSRMCIKLDIDLSAQDFNTVYASKEFRNRNAHYYNSLMLFYPFNALRCLRLYRRMKRVADWR